MLRGRFGNTSGRPFIAGRLVIPRLGLHSDISFLVDTGADSTVLLVDDALKMLVDYSKLKLDGGESIGMSGASRLYSEPAIVTFEEAGRRLHVYDIQLKITPFNRKLRRVPSLLGRDVIDRWRMSYNPSKDRLTFHVNSADDTIEIT